jgi:AsmA protein
MEDTRGKRGGLMRKLFLVLGLLLLLVVLAVAILVLVVDINDYRAEVGEAASRALGVPVAIGGGMELAVYPRLALEARDVRLGEGKESPAAERVSVGVALLPLLRGEVRQWSVTVSSPRISLRRTREGRIEIPGVGQPQREAGEASPPPPLEELQVTGGTLSFTDEASGRNVRLGGMEVRIRDITLRGDTVPGGLSFLGTASCETLEVNTVRISDVSMDMRVQGGTVVLSPVRLRVFGAEGEGDVRWEGGREPPLLSVRYEFESMRLEEISLAFGQEPVLEGSVSLRAELSAEGGDMGAMRRSLSGEARLAGEDLTLHTVELDALLSKYQKSQRVGLVDVGAFALAGPLGVAISKGFDLADTYVETWGGEGDIRRLVADWGIQNGVAEARDVAFATENNRVALLGRVDLAKGAFEDMTVAVLDRKGCAKVTQEVRGSLAKPEVRVGAVETLTGPLADVFKKAKKVVALGRCSAVYNGTVAHPE